MAEERTVTKIVFYDSSDDEEENRRRGACQTNGATAVSIGLPPMTMCEEDMLDPSEVARAGSATSGDGEFVEDTTASVRAARGEDNASRIEVVGMSIDGIEEFAEEEHDAGESKVAQFRRVEQVGEAISTLKRFREEGEEEADANLTSSSFMRNICPDGVPKPVLLPGGRRIETDDGQVGWGDAIAPEEVKDENFYRRQYPRSVPMATHIVKVTPEGYQLSLDEADVLMYAEDDEEYEESDDELDDLITVSAIEQLAAACRRYNPDEEGGGMCVPGNELDAEDAPVASEEHADPSASSGPPPAEEEATAEIANNEDDEDEVPVVVDKLCKRFRPRSFDEFANKADEWLRKLREGEAVIGEVCDALADDIWRVEGALKRLNAPKAEPIIIDGVKMDF